MRRRSALWPLALTIGCFGEPNYEGRRCNADIDCPYALLCEKNICVAGLSGDGGTTLPKLGPLAALSTRNKHSLALTAQGQVWAWGWNEHGQVGAAAGNQTSPVRVALDNVDLIAAGGVMSLARQRDGTLWAWGRNLYGELGTNSVGETSHPEPALVIGPQGSGLFTGTVALAAGYDFTLVLRDDDSVWAFGANDRSQLGDGNNRPASTPQLVPGLSRILRIAAGAFHGVALSADGQVFTWGDDQYGQLGRMATPVNRRSPGVVLGPDGSAPLTNIARISAGWGHTVAYASDGSVYAWGWNASGQLGDGTRTDRALPVRVKSPDAAATLRDASDVVAGFAFTLVRTPRNTAYAFGFNRYSQLGDATNSDRTLPVEVFVEPGFLLSTNELVAGGDHAFAFTDDRKIVGWGRNEHGELGLGDLEGRPRPTEVPSLGP